MRSVSGRQPRSTCPEGAPWRHLAVRVIDQAFRDLAGHAGSLADQQSARAFLAGSSMFYRWCEIADLDPAWMVARARTLLAGSARDGMGAAGSDQTLRQLAAKQSTTANVGSEPVKIGWPAHQHQRPTG